MREIRQSGSEGGGADFNRSSLPLSGQKVSYCRSGLADSQNKKPRETRECCEVQQGRVMCFLF